MLPLVLDQVSFGVNGKTIIEIDGTPVQVQLGLSLTIIGSKELPQDAPPAAPQPVGEAVA